MQEDQVLKKAMDEWERVSQDPEVILAYEARRKALLDEKSALRRAENQGETKARRTVVLSMTEKGMNPTEIAGLTGIPEEIIKKLLQQ